MIKTWMKLFLLILTSNSLLGQTYDSAFGCPILVYAQTFSGISKIKSDDITLIVYEKGQVIYKVLDDRFNKTYYIYKYPIKSLPKFINSFGIVDSIYSYDINDYEEHVGTIEDGSYTRLILNLKNKKEIIIHQYPTSSQENRKYLPNYILKVFDSLANYTNPNAKIWFPSNFYIELNSEIVYKVTRIKPWLKDFPDLNSSSSKKISETKYRITVDKSKYKEFMNYYSAIKFGELVNVNGIHMNVYCNYNLPSFND